MTREINDAAITPDAPQTREDGGARVPIGGVEQEIEGVEEEIKGVKEEIEGVKEEIKGVKQKIEGVEQEIEGVEEQIRTCNDPEEKKELRKEKGRLDDRETQLLAKETQLLANLTQHQTNKAQLWAKKERLLEHIQHKREVVSHSKRSRFEDLVVQNENPRNVEYIRRATQTTGAVKKRITEYFEKHGELKRRRLFEEPLWHWVPNFADSSTRGLDHRFMALSSSFMVMGRSALGPLRQKICDMIDQKLVYDVGYPMNTAVMLVHGPMGSGKSHIVFLLIWDLAIEFAPLTRGMSKSRRVRFIPIFDCQVAVEKSVDGLLGSFIWAFTDDEKSIRELGAISNVEQLKDFLRNTADTLVYVLDQWQVLENNSDAQKWLISIIKSAYHIFQVRVTSAGGEDLKREISTSHNKAYLYPLSGGLNEVEMLRFNLIHGTGCKTKAVQALVDEQLGRNPFMLASWRQHWLRSTSRPGQPANQSFLKQFQEKIEGGADCILGVGPDPALPSEPKAIDENLPDEEDPRLLRVRGGDNVGKGKEAAAEDVTEAGDVTESEDVTEAGDVTEAEAEKRKKEAEKRKKEAEKRKKEAEKRKKEGRDWKAWCSFLNSSDVLEIRLSIQSMLANSKSDVALSYEMLRRLGNIVLDGSDCIALNRNILSNTNLRYFVYDTKEGRLSCAFPLVRAELARVLDELEECNFFHRRQAWDALETAVENKEPPSVVGLFAERCCNAAIAVGGGHTAILGRVTKRKPTVTYFQTGTEEKVAKDAVEKFKTSGMDEDCFVFLPQSSCYEAVDNIVVHLYREKKAAKKTHMKPSKAVEGDICMDLVKTQVTLQSMVKHSVSTISAMAPANISPWIKAVNGKVQVTMAYVVPGQTIPEGKERETVEGDPPKETGEEQGSQRRRVRRQVQHTILQIPFGKVHEELKILDQCSYWK